MKWVLATRNLGKVAEFQRLVDELNGEVEWLSLQEVGFNDLISETGDSLAENARIKSWAVFQKIGLPVLSDDSGLFVDAINGNPGVRSARYAGELASDHQNNEKLLEDLSNIVDRDAYFSVVLCAILEGKEMLFEGRVEGSIAKSSKGSDGFGYDPIFIPKGFQQSFAEISAIEKDAISHRRKAMEQFIRWKKNFF